MFTKSSEKLESLVGAQADFKGELHVKGTLRVDGKINGLIHADCVVLGETASIYGDITARKIIVGGKVEGNIRALELVEIKSKGKVLGEILAPRFSVVDGGEFNGKIDMKREPSKVLPLEGLADSAG